VHGIQDLNVANHERMRLFRIAFYKSAAPTQIGFVKTLKRAPMASLFASRSDFEFLLNSVKKLSTPSFLN
jgi:hypothetical protein